METAVNFLLDASPKVGERVLIVGQGIVGLLTSGLLAQFPLAGLFAVSIADRQRWAEQSGVNRCLISISRTNWLNFTTSCARMNSTEARI